MPKYDYQCEACGRVIEVEHAMSAPGPEVCSCGAQGKLRRLLSSGSGLIFKGSGFYITDYARKSSSAAAAGEAKKESSCCACAAADSSSCPMNAKD